jgi:two-component system response regulator AtoC
MSRVLIVDDEPGLRQSLGLLLGDAGYDVASEGDGRRALERATAEPFDLVLCDVRMPQLSGLEFLRAYRERGGTALVIMMSAYGGEDAALAAMKEGAYDYVPKPFRPDEVVLALRKAEERERLRHTVAGLRAQLDSGPDARALVAASPAMQAALDLVARVAEHPTTVLITGESGTGKEVIAHAIHRASPRAGAAFIGVNCAAIPDSLLESELFGHVRGAFTGATADKAGLFEQADGGTLLLDEIGEMSALMQVKLLRAIQEREITRVGAERPLPVDIRLVCASNRDLRKLVEAGRFREDLYYRVNVIQLRIAPLRERPEDILWLARRILAELTARHSGPPRRLSPAAESALLRHDWPGNVRELRHAIERACVLGRGSVLQPWDLFQSEESGLNQCATPTDEATLGRYLRNCEREFILRALEAQAWRVSDTAQELGISRKNLWEKMRKLGIPGRPE